MQIDYLLYIANRFQIDYLQIDYLLYIANRFQVAVRLFSNRGRQNVVRTSVTHSAAPRVPSRVRVVRTDVLTTSFNDYVIYTSVLQ